MFWANFWGSFCVKILYAYPSSVIKFFCTGARSQVKPIKMKVEGSRNKDQETKNEKQGKYSLFLFFHNLTLTDFFFLRSSLKLLNPG